MTVLAAVPAPATGHTNCALCARGWIPVGTADAHVLIDAVDSVDEIVQLKEAA